MARIWILTAMTILILFPSPTSARTAPASDDSLPRLVLRAGSENQRGKLWNSAEGTREGDECVTPVLIDPEPRPPRRSVELRRGRPFRGRIRIYRDEEPRVRLRAYTELYGDSSTVSPNTDDTIRYNSRQPVRWDLGAVPSVTDPQRWVVRFRTRAADHVYLDLSATWRDASGCADRGDYLFHLARESGERRPAAGSPTTG